MDLGSAIPQMNMEIRLGAKAQNRKRPKRGRSVAYSFCCAAISSPAFRISLLTKTLKGASKPDINDNIKTKITINGAFCIRIFNKYRYVSIKTRKFFIHQSTYL